MSLGKKITVAIVDDHNLIRDGYKGTLSRVNRFDVVYDTASGQELIDWIAEAGIYPDVCIVDISMKGMDGYETTAIIKQRWPQIKVLAVSMFDNEFNIIKMLRAGASGYLTKESEPLDFADAVLGVFTDPYYYSDIVSGRLVRKVLSRNPDDEGVTDDETEFLLWSGSDLSYDEIAQEMGFTKRNLEYLREALFKKLDIHSRHGLVAYAMSVGLQLRK